MARQQDKPLTPLQLVTLIVGFAALAGGIYALVSGERADRQNSVKGERDARRDSDQIMLQLLHRSDDWLLGELYRLQDRVIYLERSCK